jgi:hypothetical protein
VIPQHLLDAIAAGERVVVLRHPSTELPEALVGREDLGFRTDPYAPLNSLYFMRASEAPE